MVSAAEPEGPPTARAVVDLLNSRAYAIHPDKLDDPALAFELLAPFGQDSATVSPDRISLVKGVRTALMAAVDIEEGGDPVAAWAAANDGTADVTFRLDFAAPAGVRHAQVSGDPVLGGVVLAVSELIGDGVWSRLRVCANHTCRRVFYDTTRSRTRRWHSYEVCGNRANVAAYRARNTVG